MTYSNAGISDDINRNQPGDASLPHIIAIHEYRLQLHDLRPRASELPLQRRDLSLQPHHHRRLHTTKTVSHNSHTHTHSMRAIQTPSSHTASQPIQLYGVCGHLHVTTSLTWTVCSFLAAAAAAAAYRLRLRSPTFLNFLEPAPCSCQQHRPPAHCLSTLPRHTASAHYTALAHYTTLHYTTLRYTA
jgi:hypothetical protein